MDLSRQRSRFASRLTVLALLALVASSAIAETQATDAPALETGATSTVDRELYLEVFINEEPTDLIGAFVHRSDGELASSPEELAELGIKPRTKAQDRTGLISLDRLPGLTYRLDEAAQRLYVSTGDAGRAPRVIDLSVTADQERLKPRSDTGAVLNYALFAGSNALFEGDGALFRGVSGSFDGRLFSRFGTLNQSFIAEYSDGALNGFTRLNTTWAYSDPERLLTFKAGDFISGGLSWTRPVYLGGLQMRRNFSLRPDLVSLPLPSFSGTAAVPSTLEIYTQNARTYSGDVSSGPFRVVNLPVFTGSGEARVVLRDRFGRETVTTLPFYTSSMLLREGLLDFSVEAGFPRRNFGLRSGDYDERVYGIASVRYGLTNWLTLEGHVELGEDLVNAGAGVAFPLGTYGAASVALAGSRSGGQTGGLVNATLELRHNDWSFYGRIQRAFDSYQDVASITADRVSVGSGLPVFSAGVPRAVDQVAIGVPMPLDLSSLNLSYTHLKDADGDRSQILGLSYSQRIFERGNLYASAFTDLEDDDSFGVFAGVSFPLGGDVNVTTGVESRPDGVNGFVELAKSEKLENGSFGWRLRTSEGETPDRRASASYRASFARFEAAIQQHDNKVRATAQVDGAIVVAGGGVFATNRIDDAFAVVDVGASDVVVKHQNRPVGRTNRQGRILVPRLNSYERNTVSIDPENLPVDASVPATREVVVPAYGSGVVLDFGVSDTPNAALVELVDADGIPLPVGLSGRLRDGDEFVVGYDGQAYLTGLRARNALMVLRQDGTSCSAEFSYESDPGSQVTIQGVTCR